MSENLKERTAKNFFWAALSNGTQQVVMLLVGILLARLLAPEVFGLLALMMVFVNLANTFVQSGFGVALVQNKTTKDEKGITIFNSCYSVICGLYIQTEDGNFSRYRGGYNKLDYYRAC
jgi:O-antigen/teichoic acid export membrane protein